ncbi:acyl carrier protein [Oscillatoria sp. CS-180]|uniref:acyl carrier protein n=1 Tax=Oscillatoria sp. CS-180 TaxID=3021720 RepID=UPI00232FD13D|nr:acyl carrier protein [Oscillatoria sp. CS-180]MDB9526152.1 acyl carrier protein [Oscillatoria sp. CS-180]
MSNSIVQTLPSDASNNVPAKTATANEIQEWIVDYLAELLEMDSDEVETDVPFDRFGLDSTAAIGMTGDLEDWLECRLDPTLLYDYPTIESLSGHLATA